jgi:hypothetical protein
MMPVLHKWKIYCETEAAWQYEWIAQGDPELDYCPVNVAHTVKSGSQVIDTIGVAEETTAFTDLSDTPSTYTGAQSYVVVVTPTESGIQFVNRLSNVDFDTTVSGVDPVESHDLVTKGYVDGIVDTAISGVADDVPCLQLRRTTDYNFQTAWNDVTFDTTDIENNSSILEHDDANTDRILIKESGHYKITYTMPVEPDSTTTFEGRFMVNDATQIDGSWMHVRDGNDKDEMSNDFIAYLTAGEYITLQLKASTSDGDAKADIVVTVIRLRGTRGADGAQGPAGSGSTLNIYKDGDLVAGSPFEAINFASFDFVDQTSSGVVTVSGAGTGSRDICVAFAAYDKNFYKFKDDNDWEECTVFVFRGSVTLGTPTSAKVVAKMDGNTSPNGQMRLYDLTNNAVIATWSSINNNQDAIYTTSVANIPSEESMFSVQGKKGGSYTLLRSLTLVF